MTLNCDAAFEGKITCDLEYDMRDLTNFYQTLKSPKIGTFIEYFSPK